MEIILKEDVVNLGYKNDIVTVKSGYGRNYLIPTGKAVIASPSAKKMLAEELKQRAHKLEKIKKDAEAMAEQQQKMNEGQYLNPNENNEEGDNAEEQNPFDLYAEENEEEDTNKGGLRETFVKAFDNFLNNEENGSE